MKKRIATYVACFLVTALSIGMPYLFLKNLAKQGKLHPATVQMGALVSIICILVGSRFVSKCETQTCVEELDVILERIRSLNLDDRTTKTLGSNPNQGADGGVSAGNASAEPQSDGTG